MDADICIEMTDVCKRYGGRTVLDGIALRVRRGECVAVTGENGCGKSTLLRIAAGLTRPDGGRIVRADACGLQYVPDTFPPLAVTGRQFLRAMARVDNVPDEELVRRFSMTAYLDQPVSSYSRGMRSKLGALQALLAQPGLMLLDEPVSGQDADARGVFIAAVQRRMAQGCAVLMACHERELIDALATDVLCISGGRLQPGNAAAGKAQNACLCAKCARYRDGSCKGGEGCHA